MIPSLFLVEIAVFFFYWQKGLLRLKIKATFDILKNFNHIRKRYQKIQSGRTVSDKEIIKNFSDDLAVPKEVADKKSNQLFNNFIKDLSKITKKSI